MNFLDHGFTDLELIGWEAYINDMLFIGMMALLGLEVIVYAWQRRLSWQWLGDSITNFATLFSYLMIGTVLYRVMYLAGFYWLYEYAAITKLPMTGWSILGCILLADLVYYWEHRFMHASGIGWATHTVHHSSPNFNISVAYRFGPLDGFFPFFFHAPLVLMGFHPFMVWLAESLVQLYQTALHTQLVKKFPRWIEAVFNTPSHHRVHHATNTPYLDKNYAGILIIWDRWFGTFAEEREPVRFGIHPAINSINPFIVFFHGFYKLGQQVASAPTLKLRWQVLVKSPLWTWQQQRAGAFDSPTQRSRRHGR